MEARQSHGSACVEVEASQGEAREGREVNKPVWFITTAEYCDLLEQCMSQYQSGPAEQWHPEDLHNNLEAIMFTIRAVFGHIERKDRENRAK